ncbi:MAG: proprotein convertase P-domain-containing protein [Myxococcales bacterium]|nr:proprotein convertase P-domain-containing protein [Myxococcales bacterium]
MALVACASPGGRGDIDDMDPEPVGSPPLLSLDSPAAGSVIGGTVNVSATATDDDGISYVRFTLPDGTTFTDEAAPFSTTWDSELVGNGPHTLSATAMDRAGVNTMATVQVEVANVTLNLPPDLVIGQPAGGADVAATVTILATATDPDGAIASVRFTLPGGQVVTDSAAPYSVTWDTSTVGNGAHTISVAATDNAGATTTSAITLNVNNGGNLPPALSILTPASGATVSGSKLILVSASDADGIASVRFDLPGGGSVTDTTSPYSLMWNTALVPDGLRTVAVTAADGTGITRSASVTVRVANGVNFPPTVAITSPASGVNVAGTLTITADASDPEGLPTSVRFELPDGSVVTDSAAPYSATWNTATRANGAWSIIARATDAAGATVSATVTVNVYNGGTNYPPGVWFTAPSNNASVSGELSIVAGASDPDGSVAWVRFDLPDGTSVTDRAAPFSTTWQTGTAAKGSTPYIHATTVDNLGSRATARVRVTIANASDNRHPVVSIVAPAEGEVAYGQLTVWATAEDPDGSVAKVQFLLPDASGEIDTTPPYSVTWDTRRQPNGARRIWAIATDDAGASTATSVLVNVANGSVTSCLNAVAAATGLPLSIPDNSTAGVDSSVVVAGAGVVSSLALSLEVRHPYRGDLVVTLTSPTGTSYDLWNRTGSSADDLLLIDVPVQAFVGQRAAGTWRLNVSDRGVGLSGRLVAWSLKVVASCADAPRPAGGAFEFAAANTLSATRATVRRTVALAAGTTVRAGTCGVIGGASAQGTLVRLLDAAGVIVDSTDDTCGGAGSRVTYVVPADGLYTIAAGCTAETSCSGTVAWEFSGSKAYSATGTYDGRNNTVNVNVPMVAGQSITFGTCGMPGSSSLGNTYLRLNNPSGSNIASSNDACGGEASKASFTAVTSGTYVLRMGCYDYLSCSGTTAWLVR